MSLQSLQFDLRLLIKKLSAQDYETEKLVFAPPATDAEVQALEKELDISLPSSLRDILTKVSGHVDFRWSAPDGIEFPDPFRSNFCGELHWSLKMLREFEASRQRWIEVCFPDPDNDYDRVWHNKLAFQGVGNGQLAFQGVGNGQLAFQGVGNGDLIAIDLAPERTGNVVYLSHDDGEGHGQVLAPSFHALIERWVPLACTGGEDWQWLPFVSRDGEGLDPVGDNARAWRTLLQIA